MLNTNNVKQREASSSHTFFENLPELIKPSVAASIIGRTVATIYDWSCRRKTRKVPESLFIKLNGRLLIRTKVLEEWIISQNPSLS